MGSRLEDALVKLEAYDACSVRVGLRTLVDLSGRDAKHSSEIASALLWSGDDEEDVHRAACEALGALGPRLPAAEVSALAGQLRHPRGAVRAAAARALGAVGPAGGSRHADEVAALASDPHEDAQLSGAECLSALGEAQRLAAFVQSSSPPAVRVALLGLGRAAQARLDHAGLIAAQLAHPDAGVRLAACQASGEIGGSCTEEHLARLAAAASAEGEAKVRRAAVQALGRAGGPGVPHLAAFFRDKDEAIRHYAAEVLAQVGGEATASCAAGLLRDASPEVRRAALLALGRTGPAGLHHAAALAERAAADADRAARLAAIQALGEVGAEGQAGAVGQLAGEPDQGIRFAAVCALAKLGGGGAAAALPFLEDVDPAVRQAAVKVYSPLHSRLAADVARPHAPAVAARLTLDEDWCVRQAAVVALGDLRVPECAEEVALLYRDGSTQVRRSAVTALVKMGAPAVYVAAFLQDGDASVRSEAQKGHEAASAAEKVQEGGDVPEVE